MLDGTGIGILEQASPMIQDLFKGHITAVAAVVEAAKDTVLDSFAEAAFAVAQRRVEPVQLTQHRASGTQSTESHGRLHQERQCPELSI